MRINLKNHKHIREILNKILFKDFKQKLNGISGNYSVRFHFLQKLL